jgi:hypothetical protein
MHSGFGKRSAARAPRQTTAAPTLEAAERPARNLTPMRDPTHLRRAMLAIGLTVAIVGGMFLLPKLGQCDGSRGALGLDWCRLMKASVEGGVRGVAAGRGTMPGSPR